MGVIKMLLVTVLVVSLAHLTVAASTPVVSDDGTDNMVDDAWPATGAATDVPVDVVVLGGHTPVTAAPGLADITSRQKFVANKCFYFKCNTKKIEKVVRHVWPCFFKVALAFKPKRKGSRCHSTPYACTKSACGGWRRCTCDACKTVKFAFPVWCLKN
eukprot:TRINITY_DN900_c0_g1_i1.p1 TRINITY_DN900_c0_g1~~TRINITY_DN900_c0_g1_i1.p1  ORF type:complete len:158 (-),score=44.68 TRINITY_DN900_c0_g1_i1:180-653(-)